MKRLFLTVLACAGLCGTAAAQRAPAPAGSGGQPVPIDSGIKWTADMWRAAFIGYVNTSKGTAQDLQLQRPVVGGASPYADWQDSAADKNTGRVRVQNSAGQFQIGVVDDEGNNFAPWLTCTRSGTIVTGCSVGGGLQAGGLTFNAPLSGSSLGTGSVINLAPDQVVQGSLKVTGSNTPKFIFQSLLAPNQAQIYESGAGDLVFDTGDTDRSHIFYGNVDFLGWLTNPGMALANPGSGAHFVCVNDSGVYYRSDSACK
ncbi:hypothetical protein [Gluconobacter cerinus]|uniref:hypothetical protein n=1 Tax=Gluconobacter cerinus TaxID=38307 RepID=UPI001B8C3BF2|nr:hypothetical protein [Gluconobacter cerinus]MBS0995859.1 hypothetical protein [Gluconobacter cerinus]